MPYAVCATFHLHPGARDAFMPHIVENAARSRAEESGCRLFDVCTDPARPDTVFLYEVYDDAAAFDTHKAAAHYAAFADATAALVAAKDVVTWAEVAR